MRESPAGMGVLGGGAEELVKNAMFFVKSAKSGRRKMCVFFDLRAKSAKKGKSASFFACRSLSEAEARRIVKMGDLELEGRVQTGQGLWRALRRTAEWLCVRGMGVLLCAGG
jgi:hypothetical protein